MVETFECQICGLRGLLWKFKVGEGSATAITCYRCGALGWGNIKQIYPKEN